MLDSSGNPLVEKEVGPSRPIFVGQVGFTKQELVAIGTNRQVFRYELSRKLKACESAMFQAWKINMEARGN